jgi:hypothetical protein
MEDVTSYSEEKEDEMPIMTEGHPRVWRHIDDILNLSIFKLWHLRILIQGANDMTL